ncbi:hypothetical protein DL766_006579 [Monosporascus sp. MC13-8B]|uniref:Uncharacterized protein n=1 Tax=Monosporascus cannonballus TaxID=155416 RepID=A0ABY0H018_9PEZI|nr:hypothetical protein DL762_007262 [Monosporascus cannonballus]RYP26868.1 hypothetical protein DL766_006579 [Monosporascus sp. MC13-8B]
MDGFKNPYEPRPAPPKPARSGEPSQPWTTTRCHRLLRPLISRIASLRRDIAVSLPKQPLDHGQGPDRAGAKRKSSECGWLLPRKKVHRTYSQKRSRLPAEEHSRADGKPANLKTVKCLRQGATVTLHGEIVAPTPLLRRARGQIVSSPAQNPDVFGEHKQAAQNASQTKDARRRRRSTLPQKQLDERLTAMKPQMSPDRYSDHEAIYRSLETLLAATSDRPRENRGPRSFLDMCLRKVPQYITELGAWEKQEAERKGTFFALENTNTSMQVYNELESLGATQGWRHLRVVVRADGLRAVKEAVSEGLFDDAFLELLVDLCTVTGAPDEAEELVEAMVQREYPYPPTPDVSFAELSPLQPLATLWAFANRTGRSSYFLRQHTLLLSTGSLPQDWLGTREFESVWSLAVRAIAKEGPATDAEEFMTRSISLLSTRKQPLGGRHESLQLEKEISLANQQALVSALATIAAISSLGENEIQSSSLSEADAAKVSRISARLQYILQSSLAEVNTRNRNHMSVGTRLLHLALFLSTESRNVGARDIAKESIEAVCTQPTEYKTAREERLRQQYNTTISLLSSTARSLGRGLSLPSHDCLDRLFRRLETLGLESSILERMKAASAFTLAQQTHNVRDLIYAEKLNPDSENRIEDGHHGSQIQCPFTGYRWDATIGEWVTVSPVKQRPQPGRRRLRSSTVGANQGQAVIGPCSPSGNATLATTEDIPSTEVTPSGDICTGESPNRSYRDRVITRRRSSCSNGGGAITKEKLHDELSEDKENRVRMAKKRPRARSGRIVLAARHRSSLSRSREGDAYSDDELGM